MNKLTRWVTLIFAFFFVAVIYGVWSKIDIEVGVGSLSDLTRSGVLSIFLYWVWNATKTWVKDD